MAALRGFLSSELAAGKAIYPQPAQFLRALQLTPLDQVRVVILGQDPYHGPSQAHGLAFSVDDQVPIPPSLVNIHKELNRDLGIPIPSNGSLVHWAKNGVLLLNDVLSVERRAPASHKNRGWERFTSKVIEIVSRHRQQVVFLLWGSPAQKKAEALAELGAENGHLVLKAPHPSPLSAYRGFHGCGHFSETNTFFERNGLQPIDWQIPTGDRLL